MADDLITQSLKQIGYGLLYMFCFISIVYYFQLKFIGTLVLLILVRIVMLLYKKPTLKQFVLGLAKSIALLIPLMLILRMVGYTLGILILVSVILYFKKDKYFEAKHEIERRIFGKTLYKFREEGKKPPKVVIDW